MNIVPACPRTHCINKGILVLDADSVVFLLNGIILFVRDTYEELREWDRRLSKIEETLAEVLSIFCRCAPDGQLHIPETILHEELDLVKPSRSVEKWLPGSYLGALRKRHLRVVQNGLAASVHPSPVNDDEKESLRQIFGPEARPGDRDATVLLLACELSHSGQRTLVVAHDHGYKRPISILQRTSMVQLASGRTLSPTHLEWRPYENFVLRLHESCCLDSERFDRLSFAFCRPQWKRLEEIDNRGTRARIIGGVLPFYDQSRLSLNAKRVSPCVPAWQM